MIFGQYYIIEFLNVKIIINKKHGLDLIDSIIFYDDYEKGFERLRLEGSDNPFNGKYYKRT